MLEGGSPVEYFLDESRSWGLTVEALEASINKAKEEGVTTKALAVRGYRARVFSSMCVHACYDMYGVRMAR